MLISYIFYLSLYSVQLIKLFNIYEIFPKYYLTFFFLMSYLYVQKLRY